SPGTQAQSLRDRLATRVACPATDVDALHRRAFRAQDALRSAARSSERAAASRFAARLARNARARGARRAVDEPRRAYVRSGARARAVHCRRGTSLRRAAKA